eukprot:2768196-Pyramimonas_sp.AAC.1
MVGPTQLDTPGAHERLREVQVLTKAATDGTQRDFTYARDLTQENIDARAHGLLIDREIPMANAPPCSHHPTS